MNVSLLLLICGAVCYLYVQQYQFATKFKVHREDDRRKKNDSNWVCNNNKYCRDNIDQPHLCCKHRFLYAFFNMKEKKKKETK